MYRALTFVYQHQCLSFRREKTFIFGG